MIHYTDSSELNAYPKYRYRCIHSVCACAKGFADGTNCKEPGCQCKRHKRHSLDPYLKRFPWRRKWQPTPLLLPGISPWTEEPGRLQSIGSKRVGHNGSDIHSVNTIIILPYVIVIFLLQFLYYYLIFRSLKKTPLYLHT